MRLPGRIAAAIEILDDIQARHRPVSEALRDWGLSHRFAGAGDRAAIGNLVYDALRRKLSLGWRMGVESSWGLAVGAAVLEWGEEPAALNAAFAEDRHGPAAISEETILRLGEDTLAEAPDHVRADVPEWCVANLRDVFGDSWVEEAAALGGRPPLDIRVNTLKGGRAKAVSQLARLGVEPTPLSPVGLRIPPAEAGRRHPNVQVEEAFQRGRIEIQDEGSQLCALLVGAEPGEQVLDFCAGAGGKTLALAAAMGNRGQIFAYDSDRSRLAPIYDRLKRADVRNVQVRSPAPDALEDIVERMDRVLVDAPCSGSGTWRRRPDAKWKLTADSLARRLEEQDTVLRDASRFVRPGGLLAYATCSLFAAEDGERVEAFLMAHPDFEPASMAEAWAKALPGVAAPAFPGGNLLLSPHRSGTDGFFLALLRRKV
ncbi:16S rRNA (cytosine967-C5)-methyltransferase [Faunimonas pinastri]|uniref:16S rRNA (Cytosine967-C5)-methyltransferase n=1 Tax=Faunimonas pinastri TaxID=1855383 RepID=A0A1H9MBH6_9HYPH|nr:RsmB/NOP family class I SAM-dependent RNA methyltransferase [Faunimonas pinastri]SER20785.1 16S rRNA (cytosine967-C5)-methyltransferase [Faunimonas pinastri]